MSDFPNGLTVTGTLSATGNVSTANGFGYLWGAGAVQIYSNGTYLRARTNSVDRLELTDAGLSVTGALSATGRISATTDTTSPTDGSAYFYKSSAGAVLSGYQIVLETGSAGSRTTKATLDNNGNLGLGVTPYSNVGGNGVNLQIANPLSAVGSGLTIGSTTTGDLQFSDAASGTGQYAGMLRYSHSSDSMQFWTASANKMTLDASGNFGLGVTPSASWDLARKIIQLSTTGAIVSSAANTIVSDNWYFDGTNSRYLTTAALSLYQQNAGTHKWSSAPSGTAASVATLAQILAVEKDKSLALQGAASVTGCGISFPATQVASSDANTLDDYEEGTWTPTQGAGLVVVGGFSSAGTYTKVGRQVTAYGQVMGATSVTAVAGTVMCGGLPFTAALQYQGAGANSSGATGFVVAVADTNVYSVDASSTAVTQCFSVTYTV